MSSLDDALRALESPEPVTRLQGARHLSRFAMPEHLAALDAALSAEDVIWVKGALKKARRRAAGKPEREQADFQLAEHPDDDVYAQAVEETTGLVVHELSPIVGAARMHARRELDDDFETSKTRQQLDRLAQVLDALDTLSRAASAPKLSDFRILDQLEKIAGPLAEEAGLKVSFDGDRDLKVVADAGLLALIAQNALANAVEAARDSIDEHPVIVAWGATDADYWLSVLDAGTGLPHNISSIFDIGSSTKPGHLGMGLAVTQQAANSLRGRIELANRPEGGTRFTFRWPRPTA